MYSFDFLLILLIISLIFIRHILVYNQTEKINYAPLEISITIIGAIMHYLLHVESVEADMLIQDSMLLLLIGFIYFMIMNVLHQTVTKSKERMYDRHEHRLDEKIDELSKNIELMQSQMIRLNRHEISNQESIKESFTFGSKDLTQVQENQELFLDKFETILHKQEAVLESFEQFSSEQMPELDSVVHRHIDLLRIAETDHFNKLKSLIENSMSEDNDIINELNLISNQMLNMEKRVVVNVSKGITEEVNAILRVFEKDLNTLRAHTGALSTAMSENEQVISSVRDESELLLKQMLLMSQRMQEIVGSSTVLSELFESLELLVSKVSLIKEDYILSKEEMGLIVDSFKNIDEFHYDKMKEQVELLREDLREKIESSLAQLHEHYHISERDISKSVQELSTKAKDDKNYNE